MAIVDVRVFDPVSGRVSPPVDIEIADARIRRLSPARSVRGEYLDGGGAIVVPGLIDAHLHLLATAGRRLAWEIGPGSTTSIADILDVISGAAAVTPPGEWIRAAAYDDWALREHRHPTRQELDSVAPNHPVRLMHRSYHACVLNSAAAVRCGLDVPSGLVLEPETVPALAVERLPETALVQAMAEIGTDLLASGVTQVQDASPANDAASVGLMIGAARHSPMPKITVMSDLERNDVVVAACAEHRDIVRAGHVKVICSDGPGGIRPPLDVLRRVVQAAIRRGVGVAVHSVEESTLVVTIEAFKSVAAHSGQLRIEHGALIPPALDESLAASGASVVTNPGFLADSGDRYGATVEPERLPWLYRARSLLQAGIPLAAGSDAPIGSMDPWRIIAAAVFRASASGRCLGSSERLTLLAALRLLTTGAAAVDGGGWGGGAIRPGAPADLAVLDPGLERIEDVLAADETPVRTTVLGGCVVSERG